MVGEVPYAKRLSQKGKKGGGRGVMGERTEKGKEKLIKRGNLAFFLPF